jgi:hypothetical protein
VPVSGRTNFPEKARIRESLSLVWSLTVAFRTIAA